MCTITKRNKGGKKMVKDKYSTLKHKLAKNEDRKIKSGKFYIMIFISRGSCYIDINNSFVFCGTEDLVLLKPNSSTVIHNQNGKFSLEYFIISISPDFLRELSDLDVDFEKSISFIPNNLSITRLRSESAMLIKNIVLQIIALNTNEPEYGHDLFIKNMYSLLMLQTIRSCIESDVVIKYHRNRKLILDDIFSYISVHLTDDISLESLEKEFFVSKYHICREFKRHTGLSPHAYIVKARLNLCCKYIEQGLPINEAYQLGGFNGYNHFFRAFKNEYRMTPKEYYKSIRNIKYI